MKVNIEIMKLKKLKLERNPGIKRAIDNALNELLEQHPPYVSIMWIYIDGDPIYQKRIIIN